MELTRNAVLSCEILAAHTMRTLLSVSGIVVGVAAVILMVSIGKGAEQRILDRIRRMGTHLIQVKAGQTQIVAGRERQATTVTSLLPSDAAAIAEACPSVARAAAATGRKFVVQWESEEANTNVVGMATDGFLIRNFAVASGRFFDAEEDRARRRLAVLGATVAANLFGGADSVGQTVQIGRVPFEVIGVMNPKGADPNGADQDDVILVPLETALRRLMNVACVQTVFVQARSAQVLPAAENEVRDLLRQRHRLGVKPDDFTIQNQATLLETEEMAGRSLTWLIGSVAAVSLLVGGVGILAVMLIAIRERTREIGLRRALGARRRDIRNQFLLESGILAAAGGLIGMAIGLSLTLLLSTLGYWEAVISWGAVVIGLVFSVAVGVVFGLYPALRAARLEPIVALRAE